MHCYEPVPSFSFFTGAQFDQNGNLANWWSKTSLANFIQREKCLVDQYSQCDVQGHQVSNQLCETDGSFRWSLLL